MKYYNLVSFCFVIFSLLLTSCSPYFYAPNTAQVPLFREKGEKQISGHIGTGNVIFPSIQVNAAAAVDSHLAIMGSIYSAIGEYEEEEKNIIFSGITFPLIAKNIYISNVNQAEIAVGYFKTKNAHRSVELYGGIGYGMVGTKYSRDYTNGATTKIFPFELNTDFIKLFVQKNWGYKSNYFDIILNSKLAYLHVGNIKEKHKADAEFVPASSDWSIDYIKTYPNSILLEPGLTLRTGNETYKAQLHIGTSFNILDLTYPQEYNVISLGFIYNLKYKL